MVLVPPDPHYPPPPFSMSAPTLLCEWNQPADWVLASCQWLQSNENMCTPVCMCIQNTKGKACSLGNHRLLYKEVCVISAYLGWWTRKRGRLIRARKRSFWHTHTYTHFLLAVFKKKLCCSNMWKSFSVPVVVTMFLVEVVTLGRWSSLFSISSSCPHLEVCLFEEEGWLEEKCLLDLTAVIC